VWRRKDALCQLGLDSLVETKFLYVKSDGVYARTTDGEVTRRRTARAVLGLSSRFMRAS